MKKATRVLSLTMAAVMAAGVLGGCSSSAQGGTASTADTSSAASTTASSADSGNVIRVGVVCSMTGGSVNKDAGLLSRANELEKLGNMLGVEVCKF